MIREIDEASAIELLRKLVAIESVNPVYGGSGERGVVSFLEDWMDERGIVFETQEVFPGRCNVLARIGPVDAPAILLEAHMDTVGVKGWRSGSPFDLEQDGNRYYGRGSCDTKASLATFLTVLERFAAQPARLKKALVFAATVDEESEQLGAYVLAKRLEELGVKWAITGEPTLSNVVSRHKGVGRYLINVSGKAAHASDPNSGDNAIYKASRVCGELEDLAKRLGANLVGSEIEKGTLNVGAIQGGIGFNIVPDHCQLDVDRRFGSLETPEAARAELERICARHQNVALEVFLERPALRGTHSEEFVSSMLKASSKAEVAMKELSVPYMTNAVAYEAVGIPSLVFGPGDIAQAHKVDEYIERGEIAKSLRVLEMLFSEAF